MTQAIRRDVESMLVFAQYGRTMLAVQIFEMSLAQLWLAIGLDPNPRAETLEEQARRAITRSWKAFQKMPAGEFKRELQGKIEPELVEDIEGRIAWRNVLAHRYLRERLREADDHRFKPGTLEQLAKLAGDFTDLGQRIETAAAKLRAEAVAGTPEPPPGFEALMAGLARRMLQGSSHEPDPSSPRSDS